MKGEVKRDEKNPEEYKSELWTKIYNLAIKKKVIGDKFKFQCNKHKIITEVKVPSDFDSIPEGGCK